MNNETRATTRVYRDDEGVYHWVYDLNMFKNHSILWTLLKAMGIVMAILFLIFIAIALTSQSSSASVPVYLAIFGIIFVAAMVLSVACYFLVAAIYGGHYIAVYTMDDQSITQSQPTDQATKSSLIGLFAAASGAAAGKPGLVFAGLSQRGRVVVSTPFKDIKSLKILPALGEIRVHSFLTWYTIYVNPEDFEFAADYMESRCIKARITR